MQERGWWKEGEGVEERVPGRWSPAFRINTSTASLLGVRQVVSSPPFPRPFIPLALALTFPVAFVLSCFPSLPPAGPSFFLSPAATRIVVHRPVILCRSHSKPPSSSSSSSSCFAFLLPTFHLALHPEVSPLSLSLSFPQDFANFSDISSPPVISQHHSSFVPRSRRRLLSLTLVPLYFSSSKRKYVESTLLDTICYVSTCGGVAHGNDTRAPFSARTEDHRTGRDR